MPDVLGTQGGLIHHLCLERNQDLVPFWEHSQVVKTAGCNPVIVYANYTVPSIWRFG